MEGKLHMSDTPETPGPSEIELLALLDEAVGATESTLLGEYLDLVANMALSALKGEQYLQHGGKEGQSLYTHILDGIFLLDQLRYIFALSDKESRLLFTAYTVHDINKLLGSADGLSKDAVPEKIKAQIHIYGLDRFFPEYAEYIHDITTLARKHPGHAQASGESFIRSNTSRYGLGLDRVEELSAIMRALDAIDLSHTLHEQMHKTTFLSHLNQYARITGVQYAFFSHQIDESRGALTNIFHNAISDHLLEFYQLVPLLLYPNGIVYLLPRGSEPHISATDITQIAARAAGEVARMTGASFTDFIEVRPLGIKVDAKCLELGRPFDDILKAIYAITQRRSFKHSELAQKARERTIASFAKIALRYPEAAPQVEALLSNEPIAQSDEWLRLGELIRSYYIFLDSHFNKNVPDAWKHIYDLLGISSEHQQVLAFFDARMDRAYVLVRDMALDEETIYNHILEDGRKLLATRTSTDARTTIFAEYLARHAHFGMQVLPNVFNTSLRQYVSNQHKQCVQCSEPLATTPWMSADVRSDIAVQTFSNRLRGGPGEPKKQVCGICQTQYLVERLSYLEIRGEHTVYLHLFPYAYQTRPFVLGLRRVMQNLQRSDLRALWLDGDRAMRRYAEAQQITAPMLTHSRQGKPHVYGVYLPSHADVLIGNLLILPLNPAGETDTERFLFALEYALILQRYFGCRVVLSASPVVPFDQSSLGDLNVDMAPLSCRGLVDRNVYRQFEEHSAKHGQLPQLWRQLTALYIIKRRVSTGQDDPLPDLVEALAFHPLGIFYTTEKLLERRVRDDRKARNSEWLLIDSSHNILPAVAELAHSKGGAWMANLSTHLQHMAQIAWERRLRGRTREKHSLMVPLDQVLKKLNYRTREQDIAFLRASSIEDIHEYLNRVADPKYRTGARPKRWEYIKDFVDIFFENILSEVYSNNTARLLNDEKLIRSAFLFYIREQIPAKVAETSEEDNDEDSEAT